MPQTRYDKLQYQEGTSDKIYALYLNQAGEKYTVLAAYGRNGGTLKKDVKYDGPDLAAATTIYDRLLREKTGKGYKLVGFTRVGIEPAESAESVSEILHDGDDVVNDMLREKPASAIREVGVHGAWLPNDVDPTRLAQLMDDDEWVMQAKEDGKHLFARRQGNKVLAFNRAGATTTIPPELTKALLQMPDGTMTDGELLHKGPFVLFDVLEFSSTDLRNDMYNTRLTVGQSLVAAIGSPLFTVVRTAGTRPEKEQLLADLIAEGAEGLILKKKDAKYTPGRPTGGGTMLRLKFRKSCEVIVQRRVGDTKESWEMFLHQGKDELINVGSVTARTLNSETGKPFYLDLAPGAFAVAEVSYLYSTPDRKLYQPVLVHFRTDKELTDCKIDQLILGGRFTREETTC